MKWMLFLLISLSGSLLNAQTIDKFYECYDSMVEFDSKHYYLSEDILEPGKEIYPIKAIRKIFENHACKSVLDFGDDRNRCDRIVSEGIPGVCHVFMEMGYFLTTSDFLGGIHVIYIRWD